MKKTTITPAPVASAPAAFSTARHHAQEAFRLGSAAANHAVLCGIELIRLRDAQPELRGRAPASGKKTASCGVLSWPELVRREVGISDDTARRWMQAARNQLPAIAGALQIEASGPEVIEAVAEVIDDSATQKIVAEVLGDKTIEQLLLPLDGGRVDIAKLPEKQRERYDLLSEAAFAGDSMAEALCAQIEAGTIKATRAYAGWVGEQTRKAQGKPGGKAATNHPFNIRAGLAKLETSLPHFDELEPEEQAALTRFWRDHKIAELLPSAWTVAR